eukprot:675144-Pleurochrysis_carterae.AAC.2
MPTCTSHHTSIKGGDVFRPQAYARTRPRGGEAGTFKLLTGVRACLRSLCAQRCAAVALSLRHAKLPNSSTAIRYMF